ncbi:MAG: DUF1292 domain-containing protein [Peptostreptococcales bacterium]
MEDNKGNGCGCGCGCDGDDEGYEPEIITLEFDDGETVECETIGVFEVDDKEYIALLPLDGTDDVYIYGYKEVDEDNFDLIDIEDEAEFEKVAGIFEKLALEDDDEEFEDMDDDEE